MYSLTFTSEASWSNCLHLSWCCLLISTTCLLVSSWTNLKFVHSSSRLPTWNLKKKLRLLWRVGEKLIEKNVGLLWCLRKFDWKKFATFAVGVWGKLIEKMLLTFMENKIHHWINWTVNNCRHTWLCSLDFSLCTLNHIWGVW